MSDRIAWVARAATLLTLTLAASAASAATLLVDATNTTGVEDGSAAHPFQTIQPAMDVAAPGDVVLVAPGVYYGTVTPADGVTLVSQAGPERTVIDGMGAGHAFGVYFNPSRVEARIEGFTVRNASYLVAAISWAGSSSYIEVDRCVLRDSLFTGVRVVLTGRALIRRTAIVGGQVGVGSFFFGWPTLENVTIDGTETGFFAYQTQPRVVNTVVSNTVVPFHLGYQAGFSGTNNAVWAPATEPAWSFPASIAADPLYVAPPSDYSLQAGSPLVDAGADVGLPFRGAAPDIGAFERDASIPQQAVELAEAIQDAPAPAFKGPADQRREAYYAKLIAVENMLESLGPWTTDLDRAGALNGVLQKLENDILARADGFHGGNPANDWITTAEEQAILVPKLQALIAAVREELAALRVK